MSATLDKVVQLSAELARERPGTELARAAEAVVASAGAPLRLAIAGRMKAGKSTLLNAMVGEVLAATDAEECTHVVTRYRAGIVRRATVVRRDGASAPGALQRTAAGVRIDLGAATVADVRRVDVEWPARALDTWTLLDTPGVGSVHADIARRGIELVASSDADESVDAVLYVAHHVHPGDWRFLTAFHDDAGVRPDPACAVAVLSRADELGGGAPDALDLAAELARRHALDPAVRRCCQTVVPVSGLLAQGAATFTDAQFRTLARVAVAADADEALRSAERFATWTDVGGTEPDARADVLASIGLFGVRIGVALLRDGSVAGATALAGALRERSGLDQLVELVHDQFLSRRDALRARGAVRSLRVALEREHDVERVEAELERIEAEDHELAELAVLAAARAGELRWSDSDLHEVELHLDPTPLPAERADLLTALERWRTKAGHPLARPAEIAAADTIARALERRIVATAG